MVHGAAPPWAGPACRRARWCGQKCAPAPKARAGSAVSAPDGNGAQGLDGGFQTPPVPKAALVTGGARRIGRILALSLADLGYAVAVHCHSSRTEADAVVGDIAGAGGTAVALAADLAGEAEVKRLLPEANAALGPI